MKARKYLGAERVVLIFVSTALLLSASRLFAQKRIMPVGNSITWGKVNNQAPPAGTEGYRKTLHEMLTNDGISTDFVGDFGSAEHSGHFADNARISWFHPDSAMDVLAALITHQPDYVILHIGTNNIGVGQPVGDYATPGSLINHLYTLVTTITNYASVDTLLLCKIVPKLSSPGDEVETVDYNNAMEIMLDDLETAQRAKIKIVDMWTPFYANQSTYYNLDVDKVHPSAAGYSAMANILYHHISNILKRTTIDEFDRTAVGLNGSNGWVAVPGINIVNVGENQGGAIQFLTTGDLRWDNLCVWNESKNLSTITVRIHPFSDAADCDKFGLAVGLDSLKSDATGYMVWVYQGFIRVNTVVEGDANNGRPVPNAVWEMDPLQPGDEFTVSYRQSQEANYFTFSVNGGDPLTLRDVNKYVGNGEDMYSGVMFRGADSPPPNNILLDNFAVESQLPDVIPPGRIYDFERFTQGNTSVTFQWTAPGNDDYTGTASSYDMRYSTSTMVTDEDFASANIVPDLPQPSDADEVEIFTVSGLLPGTRYYFRIRAIDSWGNKGELSDEVSVRTNSIGQQIETFDRPAEPDGSIGDDWVIDPTEYGIDYNEGTGEGEFTNFANDGAWGRVAVYSGRTNPAMVKMVWGRQATQDGIGRGGLTLMLTSPDLNTDGYLLWIETRWQKVSLYEIDNGDVVPGGLVDQAPYTLRDESGNIEYPGTLDTMSVVMDWNNPEGHKFDVFVNGVPAIDRALYDEERRYNSTVKYSGLMLGRIGGDNNVTSFITLSERGGAAEIQAVAGNDQIGIVGTPLPDTLKIQVRDANNTPVPGVPVTFSVMEPADASVSAPSPGDNSIRIEAEWGILSGTYSVKNDDPAASQEEYIVAPTGTGEAVYEFWVEKDTTYYFWARVISPNFWQSAIVVELDGAELWTWNSNMDNYSNDWQWDRIADMSGNPQGEIITRRLQRSIHRIRIIKAHGDVPIDKLLITPSSSYIPTGKEYVEQLLTDDNGFAGTVLTLGRTAGLNRVQARPFGTLESAEFLATGLPDVPVAMTKSNDGQFGVARDTLDLPFIVTLYDQYGNITPDTLVTFTAIEGGGTLTADTARTNKYGQASTYLVLGSGSPTNRVQATFQGYTGKDVVFTATVTSGLVKTLEGMPGQGFGQKHFVNQALPNFVKVRVFNDQDQLMDNIPVIFEVIDGDGSAGKVQPKWTDALGIAQDTLYLGQTSSIVKVVARVGNVVDTVAVDSVFFRGDRLRYFSGHGQTANVSDTLYFPVKVRVVDNVNRPVQGHPVYFATKGYGFSFTDESDSVVVNTNLSGIAAVNVNVAPIHGVYTDIVQAWADDGFNFIPESPVKFTVKVKSQASRLKEIQGDSLEWVVRERLPMPLKVQMIDVQGQPVLNQPVIWTIKEGGGQFEGTLMPTIEEMTDGDGYSQVSFTLGSVAGLYNNVVEARATDGVEPLLDSPVVFHISATSSAADSIRAFSDTQITGTVGKPLPQPVQVQVTDRLGNPVSRESVTFSIISRGGGSLDTLNAVNGSADTTKTILINNAAGVASIVWTLGDTAGTMNNVLQVTSSNGLISLNGSPVHFYASGIPDVVSASRSTIEATGPVAASGADTSFITVTLMDAHGNPIVGKRVLLQVTGGTFNFIQQPIDRTDEFGRAFGYLISLSSGEKKIRATDLDDSLLLDAEELVIFLANSAAKLITYSGDGQSGNIGTVLEDSLVIKITDANDNPVAYGPVTYEVIEGGGRILEAQPVVSDSNGYAYAHLVLGPNPGENMVRVTSNSLIGSPMYFTATGKVGQPVSMFYQSGHGQNGPAGEILPKPFVVGVKDIVGDVVAGIDIVFEVDVGGGSLITSQPVKTDAWGNAKAYFRADIVSGSTSWIKAYNSNLSGSPVMFSATANAGLARKMMYVSGNEQSGYVETAVQNPLVVKVTDRYGNPVGGVSVLFTVVQGDATLEDGVADNDNTMTNVTNSLGLTHAYVLLGRTAGTVKIEATGSFLEGSPVVFTLEVQTLQAANIEKVMGDNQKGTVNHLFVDPLCVRVLDSYRNPVPGVLVHFTKNSGGGMIVESPPVRSDSDGIASVHFMAGSSPGESIVSALWVNRAETFTLETVYNYNFPYLDKTIIPSTSNVFEGEELIIPLVGSDADRDPLTFRIGMVTPPEGAIVEQQSVSTAVFRWTPDYDQQGTYPIVLQVLDGRGGSDEITVTVNVLNTNRTPYILTTVPANDTTLAANQKIEFWVDARDPDEDTIHYSWKVDGAAQVGDSPVFEYFIDKYFIGTMRVDVFVDDGITVVSHRWMVDVTTSVQMAELAARFNKQQQTVVIRWVTSRETDNVGFNIYRSHAMDGEYVKINDELIPSISGGEYTFTDVSIVVGHTYYYRIVSIDERDNEMEYGPIMIEVPLPQALALFQNYPNPFNPVTTVRYQIPNRQNVVLTIYNMMGQRVATLIDGVKDPGYYIVEWDGKDDRGNEVSTGIYIYQLRTNQERLTRRMIKMR